MLNQRTRRSVTSPAEARVFMAAWRASGLTLPQWCRKHGIDGRSLRGWVQRGMTREEAAARLNKTVNEAVAAPACPSSNTAVDHPPHYNVGKYEVIDVIEDWRLGFNLGNVVKYVARAEHKGKDLEDLEKALWYIQRELARRKA